MPAAQFICDISNSGNLLEFGLDPFYRPADSKSLGVQTDFKDSPQLSQEEDGEFSEIAKPAAASQILRFAIGLLGLELHEKPSPWSETWLDALSVGQISFGGADVKVANEVDEGFWSDRQFKKGQTDWQQKVLDHLRRLFHKGRGSSKESVGRSGRGRVQEQLEMADFALQRITHAVNTLQRPERHVDPLIMHEYTDGMVEDVCADLKQWLEQLANTLSIYHVHILDLEVGHRDMTEKAGLLETKLKDCQADRDDAMRRFNDMEARWNEEKMRKRAAALFGVKSAEEDPKIYSQAEVDEMYDQWRKDQVDPLLEEIKALKKAQRELLAKMQFMKQDRSMPIQEETSSLLGQREITMLQAALTASSQRTLGELKPLLLRLGESIASGGLEIPEILRAIQAIPVLEIPESVETGSQVDEPTPVVASGSKDTELFQTGLKAAGKHVSPDLASLLVQLGQGFTDGSDLKRVVQMIQKLPLPVPIVLPEKPAMRSTGTNTMTPIAKETSETVQVEPGSERDFEGELRRLRESLEAQVRAAQAEAEKQRRRAEEAIKKLEEETQRLEQLIAELRRKLKELQALLEKAGLGSQVAELFQQAGLGDFLGGRDVFERLYRDALRRMRTQAEVQARLAEESSALFMRTLRDLAAHPLAAVDSLLTANEYANVIAPLQVLRFAAPVQEGDATKLMPREEEIKRPMRPMRFKTTSLLVDHADRPFSAARKEEDRKLKRAATMAAPLVPGHGISRPPGHPGHPGHQAHPAHPAHPVHPASRAGGESRSPGNSGNSWRPGQNMITSRPLANGANWPGIAVEGRTFSRAGSGEEVWHDTSPDRSSLASPVSVSPSGNGNLEAKIAASKSLAQSDRSDPLSVPLLVSAIGPRPSGQQRSQSQLIPQRSQGSQGSQRAHRAPVPSSHVLRSAGSLCADAAR